MSFLVKHPLDIGRKLLDTEIIGAFLNEHVKDTIGIKLEHIEHSELKVFLVVHLLDTLKVSDALHFSDHQT